MFSAAGRREAPSGGQLFPGWGHSALRFRVSPRGLIRRNYAGPDVGCTRERCRPTPSAAAALCSLDGPALRHFMGSAPCRPSSLLWPAHAIDPLRQRLSARPLRGRQHDGLATVNTTTDPHDGQVWRYTPSGSTIMLGGLWSGSLHGRLTSPIFSNGIPLSFRECRAADGESGSDSCRAVLRHIGWPRGLPAPQPARNDSSTPPPRFPTDAPRYALDFTTTCADSRFAMSARLAFTTSSMPPTIFAFAFFSARSMSSLMRDASHFSSIHTTRGLRAEP